MITAVDIGATKTLVAQFSKEGKLLFQERFPTSEDSQHFFTELMQRLDTLSDITQIAVGMPGQEKNGVILHCPNLPLWKNVPLVKMLEQAYRCPVVLENDAHLAALAEINAVSPLPDIGLYLTVSTGIGSGFVLEGRLPELVNNESVGHMVFHYQGKWQDWESFASGRAIVAHLGKMAHDIKTATEWKEVAERLAVGLCAIIPPLRPEVIVFGGGVGAYLKQFKEPLQKLLDERLPEYVPRPELRTAKHPNEAVLYGCYYYATHKRSVF